MVFRVTVTQAEKANIYTAPQDFKFYSNYIENLRFLKTITKNRREGR